MTHIFNVNDLRYFIIMLELLKIAFILKNLFTENRCPKIFLFG